MTSRRYLTAELDSCAFHEVNKRFRTKAARAQVRKQFLPFVYCDEAVATATTNSQARNSSTPRRLMFIFFDQTQQFKSLNLSPALDYRDHTKHAHYHTI